MGRTVAELEHSLSERELIEWQAYFIIEPFGAEALNYNFAASLAHNSNIHARRKGRPPYEAKDFMIGKRPIRMQAVKGLDEMLRAAINAHNRRVAVNG